LKKSALAGRRLEGRGAPAMYPCNSNILFALKALQYELGAGVKQSRNSVTGIT
jgi:hypothetical protein